MASDLFAPDSIRAWQQRLNASPAFAESAAQWRGRLLLIEEEAAASRSTWITVDHGVCTEARPGAAGDDTDADFVLVANAATWKALTEGRTSPAAAAMAGKLSLRKGELMALIPHARAAAALLAGFAGD